MQDMSRGACIHSYTHYDNIEPPKNSDPDGARLGSLKGVLEHIILIEYTCYMHCRMGHDVERGMILHCVLPAGLSQCPSLRGGVRDITSHTNVHNQPWVATVAVYMLSG